MEGPYELPDGWVWAKLENCVDTLDGKRIPVNSKEREKRKGNIPYYGATGQVGWIDDYIFDEELLLVGEDGAPFFDKTKRVAYIINGKSWVNNHAHVLRAIKEITSNQFLCNYMNLFDYNGFVKGTTRLKLNQGSMNYIPITLPPLPEQHRIVTKLEALLAQVNSTKDHLATVPPLIKRFRQSVLAAACLGRLTEDWRRKHPDVEPASVLLKRIREERVRRYEEECRKAEAEGRRKPKKPKNIEPQVVDTERLPELPGGWGWVELGKNVPNPKTSIKCGPFGSQLKISEYVDSGIPVFGIDNVKSNKFIWAKHKFISNEKYVQLSSFSVVPGDILITRTGTVGRTCIVPEGINKAIIGPNLLKVSLEKSLMLSRYISLYFNSEFIQREIERLSPGSTVAVFNTTNLKSLNVPLSPLAEQYIIIKRVETLFHFADEVEQRVAAATTHANHLTQSILARAFRGELVPQDPRDEPASVLLERIKQARAELKAKKKTQKIKSKTMLDFN